LQAVLHRITEVKNQDKNQTPVVEIDLDLTSMMPYERTVLALRVAGLKHKIKQFEDPQRHFEILPGYTPDAWNAWIQTLGLEPTDVPLLADEKNNNTVHATFHEEFWRDGEQLTTDVITPGLIKFENQVHERGGRVVFISGRWRDDQVQPTRTSLDQSGIPKNRIHLIIGNPGKIEEGENKVRQQKEIREKYGEPIAVFDDKLDNLTHINAAFDGNLITVMWGIPGYSFPADLKNHPHVSSTFDTE